MTINVSNLIFTLQQKISASSNETQLLYYAKAIQQLKSNLIFEVNYFSELPRSNVNIGTTYYVTADEMLYIFNGTSWDEINKTGRELYAWGNNSAGRIGDNTTANRCSPVRERCSATDWCAIASNCSLSIGIKLTGQLWSWGYNTRGQLGDGTTTNRCSPVRERCSDTNWCQATIGAYNTSAIKTSGQIWSWGCNGGGRLGDGTTVNTCSPVREFCSATDWCQVVAGLRYIVAIKTSGQLWAWGCNDNGQLGDCGLINRCSPIREFCSDTTWCFAGASCATTAAIKTAGSLWTWGSSVCGALARTAFCERIPCRESTFSSDWDKVSGDQIGSSFNGIRSGQLVSWGQNNCGQLGDGTVTVRCSPVREVCSATDWCHVSSNYRTTNAIKRDGSLWSWGQNSSGQLGDGTVTDRCSPVREITSSNNWCLSSFASAIKLAVM